MEDAQGQVVELPYVDSPNRAIQQDGSLFLLRIAKALRRLQFLDDFWHIQVINTNFFEEADHLILGSEGVDVAVEDLEQVGYDDGLKGGIERVK